MSITATTTHPCPQTPWGPSVTVGHIITQGLRLESPAQSSSTGLNPEKHVRSGNERVNGTRRLAHTHTRTSQSGDD